MENTIPSDNCETPLNALEDILPVILAYANLLNKPLNYLQIYDPFYCNGLIKTHLEVLGMNAELIHNDPVDCYKMQKQKAVPNHHLLLTNPPFSGDHIRRSLIFAKKTNNKPWLFLLPSNVIQREWFISEFMDSNETILYIAPHERYTFDMVINKDEHTTHIPFVTMWVIGGITSHDGFLEKIREYWARSDRKFRATLAQTFEELPRRIRKLLPYTSKRTHKKQLNKTTKAVEVKKQKRKTINAMNRNLFISGDTEVSVGTSRAQEMLGVKTNTSSSVPKKKKICLC